MGDVVAMGAAAMSSSSAAASRWSGKNQISTGLKLNNPQNQIHTSTQRHYVGRGAVHFRDHVVERPLLSVAVRSFTARQEGAQNAPRNTPRIGLTIARSCHAGANGRAQSSKQCRLDKPLITLTLHVVGCFTSGHDGSKISRAFFALKNASNTG